MHRRTFVQSSFASLIAASLAPAAEGRRPKILLRSSWQTVNIGDIGHTPGVLALLEKHLPQADVRLWPSDVKNGVEEMLKRRFPKVELVSGPAHLKAAFAESDFLLHGSGPSLVAAKDVDRWHKETGKPYGIYGITCGAPPAKTLELINNAKFAYFRDSVSLETVKKAGATCPIMEFGPDGAFAVDLRDDAAADKFLKANNLETGNFLCCIPRLRNTPYWKIKHTAFDEKKHARNEAMKEHDLAPLREAIIKIVRNTPLKVLVCPEDASQMEIGKENIIDKLPDDVKAKVVWRKDYWLTDEAVSTYVRSAGLFGCEMHSPIMCIGNGIPAIVCRWAEQTSKGFMWRDIGLGDWLFDFDNDDDIKRMPDAVLAFAKDTAGAKAKALKALEVVHQRQRETMAEVGKAAAV